MELVELLRATPKGRAIRIVDLNTVSNPVRGYRDETPRIICRTCGSHLLLGYGMNEDPEVSEISMKHIELCEGDPAVTLWKIDQWFKSIQRQRHAR